MRVPPSSPLGPLPLTGMHLPATADVHVAPAGVLGIGPDRLQARKSPV
jgi:hypothetical protein